MTTLTTLSKDIIELPDPSSARAWCTDARSAGNTIGYVPTMGALHDGHLSLVRRSVAENDKTVVSIFVNPLQFDDPDDLAKYPRDMQSDIDMLRSVGCDMVYFGTLEGFFPELDDLNDLVKLDSGPNGAGLEGDLRPGHLDGVRTIVNRLFTTVGDCRAYFGEKDFQQTLVVTDLATQMGYPEIVVCPTLREPSGLAMSSRNQRLNDIERQRASCIFRALQAADVAWQNGERDADALRASMRKVLSEAGVEVEYADVRDPEAWTANSPFGELARAQALIAIRMGDVRLIDNMRLESIAANTDFDEDGIGQVISAGGAWIPF